MKKHRVMKKVAGFLLCSVIIVCVWLYFGVFYALPSPEKLDEYLLSSGNYVFIPLTDVPDDLQWATIVMEDEDFYSRDMRLNILDVLRSIWLKVECARHECLTMRAATIPQQLAVNLMLISKQDRGSSLRQDLRDLALTLMITRHHTHEEILELYLNSIPYPNQIYGVEAATQFYYGKHVSDLDLAECAMLQAIKHLADFNPESHLGVAQDRQATVLNAMIAHGYIDQQEVENARQSVLAACRSEKRYP